MAAGAKKNKDNAGPRQARPRGRAAALAGRILLWLLALGLLITLASLAVSGLNGIFFSRNPHFSLRRIEVNINGQLARPDILRMLAGAGVAEGTGNIFALQVQSLREHLQTHVLVERVEICRVLPDTLRVNVYERLPVAQFLKSGGQQLDISGRLLPPVNTDSHRLLPVITGVRAPGELKVGEQSRDPMLLHALEFLKLVSVRPNCRMLDIGLVQLNYSQSQLIAHLRARPPFTSGARVILPVDDMPGAIERIELIAASSLTERLPISFMDVTYKRNPFVRR